MPDGNRHPERGGEKTDPLMTLMNTTADYPKEQTIQQMFEEQAEKTPENIALVSGKKQLTYRELNRNANRLANYLIKEVKVEPEQSVGILMERSEKMLTSILGILKAGCAYLPIDSGYPAERIKTIINDSQIKSFLTTGKFINILNKLQWECRSFESYLCLDCEDVYSIEEDYQRRLSEEEKLWDYVSAENEPESLITGGGWVNSYTGMVFSEREMEEYAANVFIKLRPLFELRRRKCWKLVRLRGLPCIKSRLM